MSVFVLNMERIDGFLNLNEILHVSHEKDIDKFLKKLKKNNKIKIIKKRKESVNKQFVFSFIYNNKRYYFKFDSLVDKNKDLVYPYNELIAYFIAKDMGLDSIFYDLAIVGEFKGVISKDFKEKNAKYIAGDELLKCIYGEDFSEHNSLIDIWHALEIYYQDLFNKKAVVSGIMYDLVKMFIFDMLLGNEDRHCSNWGIVEQLDGSKNLQPIYDNSRIVTDWAILLNMGLNIDNKTRSIEELVERFQRESSDEFSLMLSNFLWVISEENIRKIFDLIEEQTKSSISQNIKDWYLTRFEDYYNFYYDIIHRKTLKRTLI